MIRLRRGEVVDVVESDGRYELTVRIHGRNEAAIAYAATCARPQPGDTVICNTTAVELGLGTGGVHLVVAVEGREASIGDGGHAMKARYLPSQLAVDAVEETHLALVDHPSRLSGLPVVICPLHSLLAPVAIGVRAAAPTARIAYVMTDQGALDLAISRLVPALRSRGLLQTTITAGQASGGDLEAITVAGGLLGARHVADADVAIVAMGPGNLGSASRFGFASLEVASIVQTVQALAGTAIVCARLSFGDARDRHRGVSHHTRTAVSLLLPGGWTLTLPRLPRPEQRDALEGLDPATVTEVDHEPAETALRAHDGLLSSMGRGFHEDPWFFRAGAAAGLQAGYGLRTSQPS